MAARSPNENERERTRPEGAPKDEKVTEESVKEKELSPEERDKAKTDLTAALPKVDTAEKTPTGKKVGVMPEEPGASNELAKEPTILLPKFSSYRPKPNDTSTSTHWYDDESRAAKISSQNKANRG